MTGFAIIDDAWELDDLMEVNSIRYSAKLSDGSTLAAFDGNIPVGGSDVRIFTEYEAPAAFWPWRAFPKRAIGTEEDVEHLTFSLMSIDLLDTLAAADPEGKAAVVVVNEDMLLVEARDWTPPMATWTATVKEFRDARQPVPA